MGHKEPHQNAEPITDYETLLLRSADKAYNFAFRLTGNDPDARDLVQEAFTRAFEHKDRYDPNRPFEAWVIRILHNVFLDAVRRYEHKHKVSLDAPPSADEDSQWEGILRGSDRDPLDTLIKDEDERLLQKALRSLPLHYRTPVILYDIEGMSYENVSKIVGCPIGTVCSRIHQGRTLLRKEMQKFTTDMIQKMDMKKKVSSHE